MRSNPKPDHNILLQNAQGSPAQAYTNGVNRPDRMHLLILKARMMWINLPKMISLSRSQLYLFWQIAICLPEANSSYRFHASRKRLVFPARCSAKASFAKASNPLPDFLKVFS